MFLIKFIAPTVILDGLTNDYGTDFIDSIREEFKIKEQDYTKFTVSTSCPYTNKREYSVYFNNRKISKYIKDIKWFKGRTVINVYVGDNFLAPYMVPKIIKSKDGNKSIFGLNIIPSYTYTIQFVVDEERLLKDWIENGCDLGEKKKDVQEYIIINDNNYDVIKGCNIKSALSNYLENQSHFKTNITDLFSNYIMNISSIVCLDDYGSRLEKILDNVLTIKQLNNNKNI